MTSPTFQEKAVKVLRYGLLFYVGCVLIYLAPTALRTCIGGFTRVTFSNDGSVSVMVRFWYLGDTAEYELRPGRSEDGGNVWYYRLVAENGRRLARPESWDSISDELRIYALEFDGDSDSADW